MDPSIVYTSLLTVFMLIETLVELAESCDVDVWALSPVDDEDEEVMPEAVSGR